MSASDPLSARGGARPPWSAFRAELEALGFRPSKTLGQNFLVDSNAARSIAEDAGLERGSRAIEIGAGCGFLTLQLAEHGLSLLAVEIDARLLSVARRLLGGYPNVRWLLADALAGKHALALELLAEIPASGAWHLVSNLPYSCAAPLLAGVARLGNPPRSMTVLVQEELAQRLAAKPGDREWGALSVRMNLSYEIELGRPVGAQLFWPRPRVASRVVRLRLRAQRELDPPGDQDLEALLEALFQHRRKQLLGSLAGHLGSRPAAESWIRALGLDPRARPETLSPDQLLALARSPTWRRRP